MSEATQSEPLSIVRDGSDLVIGLQGDWLISHGIPEFSAVREELARDPLPEKIRFDSSLGAWDSSLPSFLMNCQDLAASKGVTFDDAELPDGARKLLVLARTVPPKADTGKTGESVPFLARVGETALSFLSESLLFVTFLGEVALSIGRMLRGHAQAQWKDVGRIIERCGPEALGIVALINFLVGVILAFVGAVQLIQFGAGIFVADLVAIATVREMGAIMTAIIMSGRTGAAFAAEIGTMTVNQEVDALKTFGISPIDSLVLPRVLAMVAMLPLLTVFADLIAIGGGLLVSTAALGLNPTEYVTRSLDAISLNSFLLGIFKGGLFGALVGTAGCYYGIQSGRDASAVGNAATSAVVASITAIIVADGLLAVLTNLLGI